MMTEKAKHFCEAYVVNGCGADAYLHAYQAKCDRAQASKRACELLKKPNIRAYVKELREKQQEKAADGAAPVIAQLRRVLQQDGLAVFNDDLTMLAPSKIPLEIRRLIKSVEVRDTLAGRTIKVTWMDKDRAADMLLRVHGAYAPEEVEQDIRITVERNADQQTRAWDADDSGEKTE